MITACSASGNKAVEPAYSDITGNITSQDITIEKTVTQSGNISTTTDTKTNESAEPAPAGTGTNHANEVEQLLQSASADLDGDGISEQIEAVQISLEAAGSDRVGELEGRLKIKSGSSNSQITFWKKSAGLTSLLTSMQFKDLDSDGSQDVFIIIPDNGASFSISHYFIYSFKKNLSYSFTSDNILADLISDFSFKYAGDNKLSIMNSTQNFSADLAIEFEEGQEPAEEYMIDVEQRAWIDPVSVDISENSRLALTTGINGIPEIKVPLPVFGLATVDMIGEIDLYYTVDSSFNPILKRFEVLDFKGANKVKVGSCEVK